MLPTVYRPRLHAALCIAFASSLVLTARIAEGQAPEGIVVGASAPSVTVTDLNGNVFRLGPSNGRPMVIEFWATWCEFCERLEPRMKSVFGKYGNRVQFAAIAVNVNQSASRVARHVTTRSLAYPVYYDASGMATAVYQVEATSYVVIVDGKGRVAYTGIGDKQDLDAAIRRVL